MREEYLRARHHTPQMEPVDVFHPLTTNLSNGMINDSRINGRKTYVRMLIRRRSEGADR